MLFGGRLVLVDYDHLPPRNNSTRLVRLGRVGSGRRWTIRALQFSHGLLNVGGKVLPGCINRSSVSSQRFVFFPLAQAAGGIGKNMNLWLLTLLRLIQPGRTFPP